MSTDRLTSANKLALVMWVIAGIAGALFAYKYYFRAFPEASVNFKVSRAEVLGRAKEFLASEGQDAASYQSAIVFEVDDNAKTYLERETGLEQANRLMSLELNVWYWDVRFFKPQQEEEFHVRVSPAGQVVGYQHHVEEARAGATLERAAAQYAAENFIESKLGIKSGWDLLPEEINSVKRPNRLDWSFTWEKHGFRAKDAPYRLNVVLQGDQVGNSEEYLKVPEAWERSYAQLRSTNLLYNQIAIIPYVLLMGSALWLGISLWRKGQADWMGAIKLGALVAALYFFMQVNQWQSTRASYDTHASYGSFVALHILLNILEAIATALTVTMVLPGAEPLYRATQPDRLRLNKAFTLRGLQSKEFFSAAVVGLSLAAAHIGFIVAFYMFGSKVGVWAPQDLNYSDAVNTSFPWIAGVAIGLLASTSEEFLFRLFAVPFMGRLTKSRVLAIILPAFSWSFLHSAYPQEPGYTRGIEVGIIGIVAGIVMLNWGILATLIWHYTVDASLVGLLLIRSNSMYFKISGVIVGAAALAPLIFSGVAYLRRGQFAPVDDLLNRAVPAPDISAGDEVAEDVAPSGKARIYDALTPGLIGVLAACLVSGGLLARVKQPAIGDYLKLSVNSRTALTDADDVLRHRGIDPKTYHHAVLLANTTDSLTNEFLRERVGVDRVNEIYDKEVPGALWRIRYFRDRQPEEFAVVLRPNGALHSVHHILSEDAPGAALSKDEAVKRAEDYLRSAQHIDLAQWSLIEAKSDKHPHRVDHQLTWEQNRALDDLGAGAQGDAKSHAHARIEVAVLGDEVANYRTYIKIPDEWRRRQSELTLPRTLVSMVLPALVLGGFMVVSLIVFLKNLRSEDARSIPWRRLAVWGLWGLAAYAMIFAFGDRIASFLNGYQTAIPLKTMLIGLGIGALLGAAVYFSGILLLFGMAWYFGRRACGEERLPGWTGMPPLYYRDAVLIGVGGTAALIGFSRLIAALSAHWPTAHRGIEASFGGDYDATLPAAAIFGTVLLRTLMFTGLVALCASFVATNVKQPWLRVLLFLGAALATVGTAWGTPADFAKQFLAGGLLLGLLMFGVTRVVRFNLLGYFLVAAGISLLAAAAKLVSQPDAFYRGNGYAVLLVLAGLLAWPLAAWRKRDRRAEA
ncbi:MAG TPA: CPBP family intramembrane glutamic endopeptidase [Candidatus Acidoferrum sp.]|nr:CPBP family intramembrane glutamic endopeptidase [Candidatus Acidoferrum sp.]